MSHWRNRHFIGPCAFFQRPSGASFPSLPAGINTDDSDPLRAGIGGTVLSGRYRGSVGNPPFLGGGRYRLLEFFWIVILESE